jgi:hypothetical protein
MSFTLSLVTKYSFLFTTCTDGATSGQLCYKRKSPLQASTKQQPELNEKQNMIEGEQKVLEGIQTLIFRMPLKTSIAQFCAAMTVCSDMGNGLPTRYSAGSHCMQKQRSTPLNIASPCLRADKFSPLPVVAVPTHLIPWNFSWPSQP